MSDIQRITIRELPDGGEQTFDGRLAWALSALIAAGQNGCTPFDRPGPRWSAYVHKLRRARLIIETVTEKHAAPYAGTHARYVLRTAVEIVQAASGEVAL